MHRDSHIISKTKPKIRIIHIFAPEIIKTDAENFRELVQKLTGKPSGEKKKYCNNKNNKARVEEKRTEEQLESRSSTSSGSSSGLSEDPSIPKKKELILRNGNGFWGLDLTRDHNQRVKEEEKGGGYLGGFSDLEGFISEINYGGGYFPLLPLDGTTDHDDHMHGFEEPALQLL